MSFKKVHIPEPAEVKVKKSKFKKDERRKKRSDRKLRTQTSPKEQLRYALKSFELLNESYGAVITPVVLTSIFALMSLEANEANVTMEERVMEALKRSNKFESQNEVAKKEIVAVCSKLVRTVRENILGSEKGVYSVAKINAAYKNIEKLHNRVARRIAKSVRRVLDGDKSQRGSDRAEDIAFEIEKIEAEREKRDRIDLAEKRAQMGRYSKTEGSEDEEEEADELDKAA